MRKISLLATVMLLAISALCFSDTIYIPADQPTIQAGIDAAVNGDSVLVAPGTYVENINFKGKTITLTSTGGAGATVIDGNQVASVVTFVTGEGSGSVLDGFTITNGDPPPSLNGGGIYCQFHSSPTIRNNIISGNGTAYWGGGIGCYLYCSPIITNNTITDNMAYVGGGLFCFGDCHPVVSNNLISANTASKDGGGISCFSDSFPLITYNTISDNSAGEHGGGIFYAGECSPNAFHNTISNNAAQYGGGISCDDSSPTLAGNHIVGNMTTGTYGYGAGILCNNGSHPSITNNVITGNISSYIGGGIRCSYYSSPVITNNTIVGNEAQGSYGAGAGIACFEKSSPTITSNTIMANSATLEGGGIYCRGTCSPSVSNTILWNNSAATGPEIWLGNSTHPSTITLSHSNVMGGQSSVHLEPGCTLNWGAAMIDADPLFVSSLENDIHLTYPSPCRNSGDNSMVTELFDFEGDPRIAHGVTDMGADEFYNHLYCTGDFSPSGPIEGKFIGLPNTWPAGLFIGSGIMSPPLQHMWGEFYLESPWLLFPLVPIPAGGVLVIPAILPTTPAPYDIPMQALIGWELSNLFVLEVR